MTSRRKVAWREGMFLRPQHFQAQDRYVEGLVAGRVEPLRPWPFGLTALAIDLDQASLGKFSLIRAAGVLPDGSCFSIPDQMPPPPPLDVPNDARDAIVHLTIPVDQNGVASFAETETAGPGIRFLVDEEPRFDLFSEDLAEEPVELARLNLRLAITRDQTDGRILLPLARVREVQNGRLVLDDRFIATCLDIAAAPRLVGSLSDLLGRAGQRVDELAIRAVEAVDGGTEALSAFLLLQSLNRWTAVLAHLKSLPAVHPERLFEALSAMAGEIATLRREERKPPKLPAYDHMNPQLSFDPLVDLLQTMLSGIIDRSAIQLPLEVMSPSDFHHVIRDHSLFDNGRFFLAARADTAARDEVARNLPNMAKIGPDARMHEIVYSALRGVPLRLMPAPPPQIRPIEGFSYFELDRSVPTWTEFTKATGIGLHVAGVWPNLRLELWCVKRPR